MLNPLEPKKPEKMIIVEISAREAHLIKILRKYSFGKIVVYKANGVIVRAEPNESQLINEEDGVELSLAK